MARIHQSLNQSSIADFCWPSSIATTGRGDRRIRNATVALHTERSSFALRAAKKEWWRGWRSESVSRPRSPCTRAIEPKFDCWCWATPQTGSQLEFSPATFGGDTVAFGAAIMPVNTLIYSPPLT